jgi:hypothetical protein
MAQSLLGCWSLAAGLVVSLASGAVRAQSPLAWKLAAGQSLVVQSRQETTSVVSFSGKKAETKINLGMELLWNVTSADESEATIKQTIRRIEFRLESEKAGKIEYDSSAKTRTTGQAREVADAVKPLLGAEVTIRMSARGEVLDAKPANAAAEALFANPAPGEEPGVFSRKAIETLLRQPLAVLPEKPVADGDTWSATSQIDASLGKFQQTTTYKLVGNVDQDGAQVAKVEFTGVLDPVAPVAKAAGGKPTLTLKSHEQSGHFHFSTAAGRLVAAEQNQKITTERPYRETTISVTLTSKQTTTVTGERGASAP